MAQDAGPAQRFAELVVRARWAVVAAWLALVGAVVLLLPAPQSVSIGSSLDAFVPGGNPYVQTEIRSIEEFGFPLLARTVVVQRNPEGLSPYAQAEAVLRAGALSQQQYEDAGPILGALPLVNTLGLFPGSAERGTTALTYLFMPPDTNLFTQTRAADRFAATYLSDPDDAFVGVTGSIPARVEQTTIVQDSLRTVEMVTVTAIILIVALHFRSVVAPFLALGTAGLSFVLTLYVAEGLGQMLDVSIPAELRPLLLALLLGVVTDYAIFFLSGVQHSLRHGTGRLGSARTATTEFAPIVAVAGITVAAGTASMLAAESSIFRAFGPAMAVTVLVAVAVSVTLIPALLALLGRAAFWPSRPDRVRPEDTAGVSPAPAAGLAPRSRGVEWLTRPRVALAVTLGCTALLLLCALPVRGLTVGVSFVPSLPPTSGATVAAQAATQGFADGILSPTVLLVEGEGITEQVDELARLRAFLEADPGVAGVLGPGQGLFQEQDLGIVLSRSGDAARFLVVMADEPLGATAIATFQRLQEALPGLLELAGLEGAQTSFGGDTALASLLTSTTRADLGRIALAALAVNLLLLVLFLRAFVLPLYLLATSVLALAASLGLTTLLFQGVLGHDGLTFYVPFAAAVLLVALGSDYNIFGVGNVWRVARERELRAAIISAVPRTSRAINAAAVTLAVSFGLLALVPLDPFRELAFVMAVGIVLDAVVVRTVLVPALLVLFGRWSWWPARPPHDAAPGDEPPAVPDAAVTTEGRAHATGP